ncbi:Armadillo repeat-containing protein 10 [Nymphon striatum]|nr:Armadillo repeat-containing protein 10 [Nymphon striatum]
MSAVDGDGFVKRIALCSAIAAGFGYVGYSVMKSAFCGIQKESEEEDVVDYKHFLNSRGSQTEICKQKTVGVQLGPEDICVITPLKSVQERVRELNLQSKSFPTTALLNGQRTIGNAILKSRSTQNTPWSSPRIVSPGVRSSLSVDNLNNDFQYPPSPKLRRHSTRRRNVSGEGRGCHQSSYSSILPIESEEALLKKLNGLFCRSRVITPNEARSLIILLYSKNEEVLIKTVNTISNCAAFTVNQDFLREAGCLTRLMILIENTSIPLRISAIQAVGNLSLNEANQKEIQDCLPLIVDNYQNTKNTELLRQTAVAALTNMAVTSLYHEDYYSPFLIQTSLYELDRGSDSLRLISLKLLVNLSCNEIMVPYVLAAQAPKNLLRLLNGKVTEEDILLRLLTLIHNLVACKYKHELEAYDLPLENKAPSPEMVFTLLFGHATIDKLINKCTNLSSHHNLEIQEYSLKIIDTISPEISK